MCDRPVEGVCWVGISFSVRDPWAGPSSSSSIADSGTAGVISIEGLNETLDLIRSIEIGDSCILGGRTADSVSMISLSRSICVC